MKVNDFLTDDLARKCAKEISEEFDDKGSAETIEVDFNVSSGKMVEPMSRVNTWFKFDTEKEYLKKTISFLTKIWRDEDTSENDAKLVRDFERQVAKELQDMTDSHSLITNSIRREMFKNVPEFLLPIKDIRFHRIELAGEDEQGYILRVEKYAKIDADTGEYSEPPQAVAPDLIRIHTETGQAFDEIIEEQKLAGNSMYKYVASAHYERYIKDVTVTLTADYSFCENPEHEKQS